LASNFLNPYGAEGSFQSETGEMVFGSSNGVTTFYPDRLSANPYVPPVVLTDFLLFNTPVGQGENSPLRKAIWATDSLTLNHRQSILTVEFAALSYTAPRKNRYRYRLEGLETGGTRSIAEASRHVYQPSPENICFPGPRINNARGMEREGHHLAITVLPAWWATWWFRSLVGLSIMGLVLGAYRTRVKSLELAAMRLEVQVSERTRELRSPRMPQ
jgi:hypothetical protein